MDVNWNPWHGCHKVSEGCLNCWMQSIDKMNGRDGNIVSLSVGQMEKPLALDRYSEFKLPAGSTVLTCFTSDFFIEEADKWRSYAWSVINYRSDCTFLILTKRPHRILECLPDDWGASGYNNVVLATSCENQKRFDERVPLIADIPCKGHVVFCAPLLERINLSLAIELGIDSVSVGGENCRNARPCFYEWVIDMYYQCLDAGTIDFQFWSTGSNFWKEGRHYSIPKTATQKEQAAKACLRINKLLS